MLPLVLFGAKTDNGAQNGRRSGCDEGFQAVTRIGNGHIIWLNERADFTPTLPNLSAISMDDGDDGVALSDDLIFDPQSEIDRLMAHTASSTIELRLERLERVPGVRAVLCLDEQSGGIIYKCPESFSDFEAARHALPLLELSRRFRSTVASLLPNDDGPVLLSVRTRHTEYVLCPDALHKMAVCVVQGLTPDAGEDAVTALALRQLRIWERTRIGASDQTIDWLFGNADE